MKTPIKLTPALKRQITSDWHEYFPELAVYSPLRLMRRVGPLLMGICLERDSSNRTYRPTFHVHNLCQAFSCVSLTLSQPLLTERTRAPVTIDVSLHASQGAEAAATLRSQVQLPFGGDITLTEIVNAYIEYTGKSFGICSTAFYKDIVHYATWLGNSAKAIECVELAVRTVNGWPELLKRPVDEVERFRETLLVNIGRQNELQMICEQQVVTLRAGELPYSSLLDL